MPSEVLSDEGDGSLREGVRGISGLTAPAQCYEALSSDELRAESSRRGYPEMPGIRGPSSGRL